MQNLAPKDHSACHLTMVSLLPWFPICEQVEVQAAASVRILVGAQSAASEWASVPEPRRDSHYPSQDLEVFGL